MFCSIGAGNLQEERALGSHDGMSFTISTIFLVQ
jgi:hypothetical protein